MVDIVIIASVLLTLAFLMFSGWWLMDRQHIHCLHTVPGEAGLEDENHGRFVRTTRRKECCTCPARFPGAVVTERLLDG